MRLAKQVALRLDEVLKPAGINIVHSSRQMAGQDVSYFHVHLVPRYSNDGVKLTWGTSAVDLALLAKQLRGKEMKQSR